MALQRVARGKAGRMVFANVDATVQEVFRVSKLEGLFTFSPDRASALVELAGPTSSADIPATAPEPPQSRRPTRARRDTIV